MGRGHNPCGKDQGGRWIIEWGQIKAGSKLDHSSPPQAACPYPNYDTVVQASVSNAKQTPDRNRSKVNACIRNAADLG